MLKFLVLLVAVLLLCSASAFWADQLAFRIGIEKIRLICTSFGAGGAVFLAIVFAALSDTSDPVFYSGFAFKVCIFLALSSVGIPLFMVFLKYFSHEIVDFGSLGAGASSVASASGVGLSIRYSIKFYQFYKTDQKAYIKRHLR